MQRNKIRLGEQAVERRVAHVQHRLVLITHAVRPPIKHTPIEAARAARRSWAPSTTRRATVSSKAKARSAVDSAASAGTTVTGMWHAVAAATSVLSGVIDIEAIMRRFGLA